MAVAYPPNLLNDGEEIVLDRHPHWSFMLGAAVMISMSIAATLVIAIVDWRFAWIGLVCLAFAVVGSFGRYLRWRSTEFTVTTDRIIVRHGVLSKTGLEIPLERVTNISFHQALWERLLGTGDLVVESAGESGQQYFTDVADPAQVQNIIYRQAEAEMERTHGGGGNASSNRKQASIPDQIDQLDQLRQRGIISETEFHKKKQELLDRM